MHSILKAVLEIAPLFIFFGSYMLYDMMIATKFLIASSLISVGITYCYTKTITKVSLYSTIAIVLLGSITLLTNDASFIKMKPTIIYLLFAVVIFAGLLKKKILLKKLFGKALEMSDKAWIIFSKRFGYFFIFIALLNEFIWRNYSEVFWVKFKVFGITTLLIVFIFSQISFISKNKEDLF